MKKNSAFAIFLLLTILIPLFFLFFTKHKDFKKFIPQTNIVKSVYGADFVANLFAASGPIRTPTRSSTPVCTSYSTECVSSSQCSSGCRACNSQGTGWYCTESHWCSWCNSVSIRTPTPTRKPNITPILTGIMNPKCLCQTNPPICTSDCTFEKYADMVYQRNRLCVLSDSLFTTPPTSQQKTDWCRRPMRTKGDGDGNGIVNNMDYFYYVSAVNGGKIPPSVNPDFNGDGEVGAQDRVIIIKTLTLNI